MTLKHALAGIMLILACDGCTDIIEKDYFTLPVQVDLEIGFNRPGYVESYAEYPCAEYFNFSNGLIGIKKIHFEGKREAGGDFMFDTAPDIHYQVAFSASESPVTQYEYVGRPAIISGFDIPQGMYHDMQWIISLEKISIEEFGIGENASIENTGLYISGNFEQICWKKDNYGLTDSVYNIPFLLAIDDEVQFRIRSFTRYNIPQIALSDNISLSDNKAWRAVVILNLPYAFASVKGESIELDDVAESDTGQMIILSKSRNTVLYERILHRLFTSSFVMIY